MTFHHVYRLVHRDPYNGFLHCSHGGTQKSGQVTIIPKPEWFGHFGVIPYKTTMLGEPFPAVGRDKRCSEKIVSKSSKGFRVSCSIFEWDSTIPLPLSDFKFSRFHKVS